MNSKNFQSVLLFNKTSHASVRCQQRAVSPTAIELALTYGQERPAGQGCVSIYLDKRALLDVREAIGAKRYAKLEQNLTGLYLIVHDDQIVTVARAH